MQRQLFLYIRGITKLCQRCKDANERKRKWKRFLHSYQANSLSMSVLSLEFDLELKEVSFNCEKNQVILSAVFWVRGSWELFWGGWECVRRHESVLRGVMSCHEYIFHAFQSSFGSCSPIEWRRRKSNGAVSRESVSNMITSVAQEMTQNEEGFANWAQIE